MKKRYSIIFSITAAAVLVSSIAYASKKKLRAKPEHLKQGMSEVDLAANLLDPNRGLQHKAPKEGLIRRLRDEPLKDLSMVDESTVHDKTVGR